MTARTIIIRQVASKHSNFVVTEYISCRPRSLMFWMFWMRKMLMSANLEWRVVREGRTPKQWARLAWAAAGSKVCVCLHFCVKPAQTKSMFMEQRFWTTLEFWMKEDGHRCPLSPLRVNFKAWMNIANENWSLLCPLIMVMWCNPSDQSLMSHCGPYWCSDWGSRESPGLLCISVWSLLSILWPAYLTRCHSMSAPRVLHIRCAPMYIPAPNFLSNASFLSC